MDEKIIGRNEPCPCGSGSKYKRCCGKDAAPKLGKPADIQDRMAKLQQSGMMPQGAQGGFDPSKLDPAQLDPAMMAQFNQALMRMPRGQLQKLQSIMQRAMAGQDVSREAAELDRIMPPELKQLAASMGGLGGFGGGGMGMPEQPSGGLSGGMSEEEARKIVEQAAKSGKISDQEAGALLSSAQKSGAKSGGISSLWKKVTGK